MMCQYVIFKNKSFMTLVNIKTYVASYEAKQNCFINNLKNTDTKI